MGAWGVKISQNDVYEDVKGSYEVYLRMGMSDEEALAKIMEEYGGYSLDYDDGPVFWMSLADIQWKWGRLTPEIKEKALESIEISRREDNIYNSDSEDVFKRRLKELDRFQQQLSQPQMKHKGFRPKRYKKCTWNDGDIFRYELVGEIAVKYDMAHKYLFLQKIGDYFDADPDFIKIDKGKNIHGDICPIVRLWISDDKNFIPDNKSRNDCIACFGIDRDDGTNSFQHYIFDMPNNPKGLEFICNSETTVPDKERMPFGNDDISHICWKYLEDLALGLFLYQKRKIKVF